MLFGGSDLEGVIEEIRKDVVGRRCRVNITEVEKLALALSHLSRSLASLKGLSFVPSVVLCIRQLGTFSLHSVCQVYELKGKK